MMKMEEIELIKRSMDFKETDYDAQFGQKMMRIQPKLKKIVQLTLGF